MMLISGASARQVRERTRQPDQAVPISNDGVTSAQTLFDELKAVVIPANHHQVRPATVSRTSPTYRIRNYRYNSPPPVGCVVPVMSRETVQSMFSSVIDLSYCLHFRDSK